MLLHPSARPVTAVLILALCLGLTVQTAPPATAASTTVTAKKKATIHSRPSSTSAKVGYLEPGQQITTVRTRKAWSEVRFAGKRAYIAKRHLTKRSVKLRVRVEAGTVRTATKALSVLAEPRSSARKVGALAEGARVTMTGRTSSGFGQIVHENSTGWVSLRQLPVMTSVLPKPVGVKVATKRLVLWKTSTTKKSSGSIASGARVKVTGVVHNGRAQVILGKKSRWVTAKYLAELPAAPEPPPDTPPSTPPVRACAQLPDRGPSTPPTGAVAIPTTEPADKVIATHPAGSTFWFAPGTHQLSPGRYAQILPRNGDTFIGAPGAVLDGRHANQYAFGGHAADVTIRSLTIQNFGTPNSNANEGVVNHDSAEGWTITSNLIQRNAGAGTMIGSRNTITGNCLRDNGQYGFNAYHPDGVADVTLSNNEITGNNTDDWETRQAGCGCTGGGKFWETRNAKVVGNYVHDNHGVGLWADTNNTGFLFDGNYISDNASSGIFYETSYNAKITNNTLIRNGLEAGPKNPGFPTAALYISESGSDSRVPGAYNEEFLVSDNRFIDNWSGVVGWENADRFAGSPANTSTNYSTLVNPYATVSRCADPYEIANKPLFDDCRWKTQNLLVVRNHFEINSTGIPQCAHSTGCGFSGIFSNYGTYPHWSPFKAAVVEKNITFQQNNRFRDNTYRGNWAFTAEEAGRIMDWETWRAAPYNQDAGSTKSS